MKKPIIFFLLLGLFVIIFFEIDFLSSLYLKNNSFIDHIVLQEDYEKLEQEYQELLDQMDLYSSLTSDRTMSKVLLHEPYNFQEQITILKGKEEGITVGDIVYNEIGYIGKVIDVKNHTSQVELITSKNTKIPVKIQNSFGILNQKDGELIVEKITSKEEIEVGSTVFTSPFSELSESYSIGTVREVKNNGIEQTLYIDSLQTLENLNYCIIRKENFHE